MLSRDQSSETTVLSIENTRSLELEEIGVATLYSLGNLFLHSYQNSITENEPEKKDDGLNPSEPASSNLY